MCQITISGRLVINLSDVLMTFPVLSFPCFDFFLVLSFSSSNYSYIDSHCTNSVHSTLSTTTQTIPFIPLQLPLLISPSHSNPNSYSSHSNSHSYSAYPTPPTFTPTPTRIMPLFPLSISLLFNSYSSLFHCTSTQLISFALLLPLPLNSCHSHSYIPVTNIATE